MDIEYSPGAPGQLLFAAARYIGGPADGEGEMSGKRLCSMDHPAVCGEHARRFLGERAMGGLWHHSSFNLVLPRSIALAGHGIPGGCRRSNLG
jgi:hypothetical protein